MNKNEVIYGPQQYGEREYFRHMHTNLIIGIKQRLAEEEFIITHQEIQNYYNINIKLFKNPDYLKIENITVQWTDDSSNPCILIRSDAEKKHLR